jgi:hypothetical protein
MFSRTGQALHPNVVVCLVAMVVTLLVTGFTLAVAAPAGQASATPASTAPGPARTHQPRHPGFQDKVARIHLPPAVAALPGGLIADATAEQALGGRGNGVNAFGVCTPATD